MAHLVHLAGLFGINPNRARVALSRMVASGEAATDGAGRYRLAGRLLERRDRQEDSLVGPHPAVGRVVAPGRGDHHRELGRAARRPPPPPRPGPPGRAARGGVAAPGQPRPAPRPAPRTPTWPSGPAAPDADPVALAASLWDLDGWAARARCSCVSARRPARPGGPTTSPPASPVGRRAAPPAVRPAAARRAAAGRLARARACGRPTARGTGAYRDVLRAWGRSARTA